MLARVNGGAGGESDHLGGAEEMARDGKSITDLGDVVITMATSDGGSGKVLIRYKKQGGPQEANGLHRPANEASFLGKGNIILDAEDDQSIPIPVEGVTYYELVSPYTVQLPRGGGGVARKKDLETVTVFRSDKEIVAVRTKKEHNRI